MFTRQELTEYAATNCDGDIFRAIYEFTIDTDYKIQDFMDIIDQFPEEEASFVKFMKTMDILYDLKSNEILLKKIGTDLNAFFIGMDYEQIISHSNNPFIKTTFTDLLKGVIGLGALFLLIYFMEEKNDMILLMFWVGILLEIILLIKNIWKIFKFNKAYKIAQELKTLKEQYKRPSFEECMESYRKDKEKNANNASS